MSYDLVIHNGTIVTVNSSFEIIENGIVCIKDGKLARVMANPDKALPRAKALIDARGGIILPGLINTHTHLPMTLFRGLADDLPLDFHIIGICIDRLHLKIGWLEANAIPLSIKLF